MSNNGDSSTGFSEKIGVTENGFLGKYDITLFWGTLILVSSITLWGIIAPEDFSKAMTRSQGWISVNFGWFFMLTVSMFIIFLAWAGVSKYGDIPLGQDGEAPEFTYTSWIAMLFSCGIGIGFIFWGVAEPLYHYTSTPYLASGGTPEAAPVAMQISLLHWGIHGWACYAVAGLAIAYTTYRLKMPLSVSKSLYGILGDKTGSLWGKLVDFLAAFATIAGIATSLGMGLMSIRFGIKHVFGADLGTTGLVRHDRPHRGLHHFRCFRPEQRHQDFKQHQHDSGVLCAGVLSLCRSYLVFTEPDG